MNNILEEEFGMTINKLDEEFARIIQHEFWVIGSRNYPEKFYTSPDGTQIFLDPMEAKTECDRRNKDFSDATGEENSRCCRVLRCTAKTAEETRWEEWE